MNGIKLKSQEKLKISKKKVIRNVKELKKARDQQSLLKFGKLEKKFTKESPKNCKKSKKKPIRIKEKLGKDKNDKIISV